MESSLPLANFIAIKVRSMKIWDAEQRGDIDGMAIGVGLAFVNVYTCLIMKVGRRFVNVLRSLNEDSITDNQLIAKFYPFAGVGELRIYTSYKQA